MADRYGVPLIRSMSRKIRFWFGLLRSSPGTMNAWKTPVETIPKDQMGSVYSSASARLGFREGTGRQ